MTAQNPVMYDAHPTIDLTHSKYGPDIVCLKSKEQIALACTAMKKFGQHYEARDYSFSGESERFVVVECDNGTMVTIIKEPRDSYHPPRKQDFRMASEGTLCHLEPKRVRATATGSGVFIETRTGIWGINKAYFVTSRQVFNTLYRPVL